MALAQRWPVESMTDSTPIRSDAPVPRVLIADDQPDVLEALRLLLKGEGYQTESVTSPGGVIEAVKAQVVRPAFHVRRRERNAECVAQRAPGPADP